MDKKYNPYKVIDGDEMLVKEESSGNVYAGSWQQQKMTEDEEMITIGTHDDPMRGPNYPSQLLIDDLYRHTAIFGERRFGKSHVLNNIQIQLIERGFGISFIDVHGDLSEELIEQIPEERLDDVVWIEPGSEKEPVNGFNILETTTQKDDDRYNREVSDNVNSLKSVIQDEVTDGWGPTIDNISFIILGEIIRSENEYNLVDLVKSISDGNYEENEEYSIEELLDLDDVSEKETTISITDLEPVIRTIRNLAQNKAMRDLISNTESTVELYDLVKDDKIIILNLNNVGNEYKKLCSRFFISMLWSKIRMAQKSDENPVYNNHFLFINEYSNITSENYDINNIISQARAYRLGIILGVQIDNLSDDESLIIDTIYNKINVGPQTQRVAAKIAQMYNIGANEITNLKSMEAISHVTATNGYKSDDPMKISLFHTPVPKRDELSKIN